MSRNPEYQFIINGRSRKDPDRVVRFGVRADTFREYVRRGLRCRVAQYYGIIENGLCDAGHLFQGLNRPLDWEGDMEADKGVLVYTWVPPNDFVWVGGSFDGTIESRYPEPGKVFAVLVREDDTEADIEGSIEHWTWVRESLDLAAPTDWKTRYDKKVWSI